jgi:hypothetical protein
MASYTVERQPVLTSINITIEAIQSPIVNAHVKAVRFRLMVALDQAVPRQRCHGLLEQKFIPSQVGKPLWSVCAWTNPKKIIPDILMIQVRQKSQELGRLGHLLFDVDQRKVPRGV